MVRFAKYFHRACDSTIESKWSFSLQSIHFYSCKNGLGAVGYPGFSETWLWITRTHIFRTPTHFIIHSVAVLCVVLFTAWRLELLLLYLALDLPMEKPRHQKLNGSNSMLLATTTKMPYFWSLHEWFAIYHCILVLGLYFRVCFGWNVRGNGCVIVLFF